MKTIEEKLQLVQKKLDIIKLVQKQLDIINELLDIKERQIITIKNQIKDINKIISLKEKEGAL